MATIRKGNLVSLAYKVHWRVVERWSELFGELKNSGLADDRSEWIISINEKGEVVIFNQCALPVEMFRIFNPEFFAKISKNFGTDWEKITRFSFEHAWESYTPPSSANGKLVFKQVGWRLKRSILGEDADDDEGGSVRTPVPEFPRKIMG